MVEIWKAEATVETGRNMVLKALRRKFFDKIACHSEYFRSMPFVVRKPFISIVCLKNNVSEDAVNSVFHFAGKSEHNCVDDDHGSHAEHHADD
jgi:hypothetical protein